MPKVTTRKTNKVDSQQEPEADELNVKPSKSDSPPNSSQPDDGYDSDDYIDLNNPRPRPRMIEFFFNRNKCTFLDLCLHDYRMELIRGGENLEAVKQDIYERYRRIWPMDARRSLRFNHVPAPYWCGPPQELRPLRERIDGYLWRHRRDGLTGATTSHRPTYDRLVAEANASKATGTADTDI